MGLGNRSTPEFRRETVRLTLTSGRTRKEVAEGLGIGPSSLTRWIGQYRGEEAMGILEGSQQILERFKYLLTARNRLDEAVNAHKRNSDS
ncbi:transposase-like protein [Labrenzia sp. EL_208]|nr:transposase-like protein [Labrenzia sp. EL_132]MBG6230826.1 transposase-like protein [Labrenzia sp. EL_208]